MPRKPTTIVRPSKKEPFLPFFEGPPSVVARRPDFSIEKLAWEDGYTCVAGVDEVGRGALAGPVVTAAVILDPECFPSGLDDSKKLSAKRRRLLAAEIEQCALAVAIGRIEADEIDRINILQATLKAMRAALDRLALSPDYVLVDGNTPIPRWAGGQKTVVSGDARSLSIAAASIVAKVARDRLMAEFETEWPGYGFSAHAGYGTEAHRQAIERLGPCPIHRKTFRGVVT